MVLTPDDVRGKQFTTVRWREGYDLHEVDAFLDEVEGELGRAHAENEGLRAQLAAAQHRMATVQAVPTAPPPPNDQMVKMLELAQKTADQAVSDARSEADRIVTDARDTATRQLAEADGLRTSLERRIDELRAFERDYRGRLRSYLESQLRDLDARAPDGNGQRGAAPAAPSAPAASAAPVAPTATPPAATHKAPAPSPTVAPPEPPAHTGFPMTSIPSVPPNGSPFGSPFGHDAPDAPPREP
jgi:DivIVA domain-containing protein